MIWLQLWLVSVWYGVGITGFVYWTSTDHEITATELPMACLVGLMGPFAWLEGYFLYRKDSQ